MKTVKYKILPISLNSNGSLKTLDLSDNKLMLYKYLDDLTKMLKVNQSLQVLRLCQCGLTQNKTAILFQVFKNNQNTTLQTLDVSENEYCTKDLEEMLSSNTSLLCVEITVKTGYFVNQSILWSPRRQSTVYEISLHHPFQRL